MRGPSGPVFLLPFGNENFTNFIRMCELEYVGRGARAKLPKGYGWFIMLQSLRGAKPQTVVAFFGRTCLQVDGELNTLLMRLPNLLDSRVPDGDGEEDNVIVSEWGQEYVKTGEVCELNCVDDSRRSLWV